MSSYDEIPDELIEHIEVKSTGYFVKKRVGNGNANTLGIFESLNEACAAARILHRNNWKINEIGVDRLVDYAGKFWVFKVEGKKLVLDKKFDDYELAVEYIEINSRCNDYHNDVFRNSLKKNGRKRRYDSSKVEDDLNIEDECIFKQEGTFFVKRSKRNWMIFGEFNSYEEAVVAKKILMDHNWNMSNEHELIFYKNYYWVFDVNDSFLIFKGKSLSYEDAFDLIDAQIPKNKFKTPYMKSTEEIYGIVKEDKLNSKSNNKSKPPKKRVRSTKAVFNSSKSGAGIKSDDSLLSGAAKRGVSGNGVVSKSSKKDVKRKKVVSKSSKKDVKRKKVVSKSSKKDVKRNEVISEYDNSEYINIKTSIVDSAKIWSPEQKVNYADNNHVRIFVERSGATADDLFSILDFTFVLDNLVKCIVDGEEIEWNKRYDVHISNFPEFELIIRILEVNNWDLLKISNSSSIYFYDNYFYKVHIVDNTLVFARFISYALAENTFIIYKGRPIIPEDCTSFGIDKNGNYYELMKFQNGDFYKTLSLKSLEETKAIRDILIHANWDFGIFDKYDLFYLNGIYWELICNNHTISLIGKYELIKTL